MIIDNFNVLSTAIAPKQIRYRSLDNSGFHSCKLDGGFKGGWGDQSVLRKLLSIKRIIYFWFFAASKKPGKKPGFAEVTRFLNWWQR
ncbi:hypothetical protein AM228_14160 [Planktothricoides sp. SR001]|nr:hypothetical protein AM228_14160 [Planktothricoides sp. SR001]